MFGWWKRLAAWWQGVVEESRRQQAIQREKRMLAAIRIEVVTTHAEPEPIPAHKQGDWDEVGSKEKIKRVPIQPLPFVDGEELSTKSKSTKRFAVRVIPQAVGVFEFDEAKAVTVFVVARGRQAAMDVVAERICGRDAYPDDS